MPGLHSWKKNPRFATLACIALFALVAGGCDKGRVGQSDSLTNPRVPMSAARTLSARNPSDVAQVIQLQDERSAELMSLPGVIGTGTSVGANGKLVILVLAKQDGVRGVPATLGGVPVETHVVGVVRAYAKPGGGGTLQCGTSTGNDKECAAGTIGCVVVKGGTNYFLSNNHVFARENAAAIGERIDAPGRYDARPVCSQTAQCATLSDFQPISFSGNNTIDCAIAKPVSSLTYTCAEAGRYTPSTTVVAPTVGLAVKKTGRTSGLTTGTIQAINVTIRVQYTAGVATFVGQIMTPGNFIKSGDSGSLMVTQSGNNPVGLCFAGGTGGSFANPIGSVLSRFSATVCGQ